MAIKLDLPEDFAKALRARKLADAFAAMPPSHRREHLKWIGEAKKAETRAARIEKAMKMIAERARGR